MALKCYSHDDNYNIEHGEHAPPTDDQKKDCGENDDVCFKGTGYIDKKYIDKIIQTIRSCEQKKDLKTDSWDGGSGCTKRIRESDGQEFNYCACTTDYCNTSTFATPFHFIPLIALSTVKIFFI